MGRVIMEGGEEGVGARGRVEEARDAVSVLAGDIVEGALRARCAVWIGGYIMYGGGLCCSLCVPRNRMSANCISRPS